MVAMKYLRFWSIVIILFWLPHWKGTVGSKFALLTKRFWFRVLFIWSILNPSATTTNVYFFFITVIILRIFSTILFLFGIQFVVVFNLQKWSFHGRMLRVRMLNNGFFIRDVVCSNCVFEAAITPQCSLFLIFGTNSIFESPLKCRVWSLRSKWCLEWICSIKSY